MTPVIVTVRQRGHEPDAALLADVMVVGLEIGACTARVCADLFTRYPGLTLLLVRHGSALAVGVRDCTLLRIGSPEAADLRRLARTLYALWCTGGDPTRWLAVDARPASWRRASVRECAAPLMVCALCSRASPGFAPSSVEQGEIAAKRRRPR